MNSFMERVGSMDMTKVVIISLLISFFYFFKVYDSGEENEARIAQLNIEIEAEMQRKNETDLALQEVERMRKAVGELGNKYQEIVRKLPADLNSLEINRSIDEFSKEAGINIVSRRPEDGTKNDIYIEELVTVEAEGEYSKIAQFIYFVSKSERLSAIKDFRVFRKGESLDDSQLSFQGTVINYRLAPEPVKPPPSEQVPVDTGEGA